MQKAIDSNPENWKSHMMFVQDVAAPGMNIAAEISQTEAYSFKNMCQLFYLHMVNGLNVQQNNNVEPNTIFNMINREININMNRHWHLKLRRRLFETEILFTIAKYLRKFNPSLELYEVGSCKYSSGSVRYKGEKTNFNLLITTGKFLLSVQFTQAKFDLIF